MAPEDKDQDQTDQTLTDTVGDDAFDTAFAEFSGDQDAGNDTQEPESEGNAPEADPTPADPWDAAPPDLRAAFKAAKDEAAQWSHKYNSDVGRLSAYQRRIEELQNELASGKKNTDAGAAGKAAQDAQDILDDPEFKAFREEYPEVAKPLEKVMSSLQQKAERLERELVSITGDRRDQFLVKQEQALAAVHPDWKEATSSPQFAQWYQAAPPYMRAAVERHGKEIADADEVAHILNTFKLSTGYGQRPAASQSGVTTLSAKRAKQLEASAAPAGRGLGAASGAPDDFEAAFDHFTRKSAQSR